MQEALIEFMTEYGYIGIVLLIFAENMFPPIPSEAVLLFGGFMAHSAGLDIWLVVASSVIGSVLGAAVLYAVGRLLKKERLIRFCGTKAGRLLRIKAEHIEKADASFKKYGMLAVLVCRCIPIVRSLISVPAGMSEMKLLPFFALTLVGTSVWNTVLSWTGYAAGEAWEQSLAAIESLKLPIVIGAAAVAAVAVTAVIVCRKKKKA